MEPSEEFEPSLGSNLHPVPIEALSPEKGKDRFTLKLDAYWEHIGEEPIGKQVIAAMNLQTCGVEPYIRKMKVKSHWQDLRLGDLEREEVGYILIVNTEGTKLQMQPTEEERELIKQKIVVFNGFEIYPSGLPFFGMPTAEEKLSIKCLSGEAVVQVCVFPR